MSMSIENLESIMSVVSFSVIVGLLIGYAVKKIMKILAVIAGIFLATLIYLQSQQIININWTNLQYAISTYTLSSTTSIASIIGSSIALTSAAAGFAIGFIKG